MLTLHIYYFSFLNTRVVNINKIIIIIIISVVFVFGAMRRQSHYTDVIFHISIGK